MVYRKYTTCFWWFFLVFGGFFCFLGGFLADTCPFWGHWYPCFRFLVMSPLVFKARVGSALFTFFCRGKCNVHSLRSTSGATLCRPLGRAGVHAGPVPTYCCRGEVAGIRTRALRISVSQTLYQLS